MTTWGMFSILVFMFIMPPIVLLNRSNLSERKLYIIGFPSIMLGHHLGWTLGPIFFGLMAGLVELPSPHSQLILFAFDIAVATIVTIILIALKHRREEEEANQRRIIQEARAKILEDGVVSGPKGDYVPHTPWDVGISSETPRETKGPGGHGSYGSPMP